MREGLGVNGLDLDDGDLLAVALLAAVALPALALDDGDLFPALVFEDLGHDACALDGGCAEACLRTFTGHQHFVDGDCVARVGVLKSVDEQDVAFLDCELTPLSFDGGFHRKRNEKRVMACGRQGFFMDFSFFEIMESKPVGVGVWGMGRVKGAGPVSQYGWFWAEENRQVFVERLAFEVFGYAVWRSA